MFGMLRECKDTCKRHEQLNETGRRELFVRTATCSPTLAGWHAIVKGEAIMQSNTRCCLTERGNHAHLRCGFTLNAAAYVFPYTHGFLPLQVEGFEVADDGTVEFREDERLERCIPLQWAKTVYIMGMPDGHCRRCIPLQWAKTVYIMGMPDGGMDEGDAAPCETPTVQNHSLPRSGLAEVWTRHPLATCWGQLAPAPPQRWTEAESVSMQGKDEESCLQWATWAGLPTMMPTMGNKGRTAHNDAHNGQHGQDCPQ
eukprot:1156186-Pelagomonas_calceolata.AAC.10